MIFNAIKELVNYAEEKNLISESDKVYCVNLIISVLGISEYKDPEEELNDTREIHQILKDITDYAVENGICEDGIVSRDLFDTKIMGLLMPRPSEVINKFNGFYEKSPKLATDWYYKLSCDSNYIRRDRIAKDRKWEVDSSYGRIDITINLSKPEKDPKAIAAAKLVKQSGYPKCQLCPENEGYAGTLTFPARQNHRIIPLTVNNSKWFFQYSPYVYYNEHCIVFNSCHVPMEINCATFKKLLDFVKQFPHYFVGSNADLPIVGGSILTHDHFQGGCYSFPMAEADFESKIEFKDYNDVEAGIVKWPMSCIRIRSSNAERLFSLADKILASWRTYTDEEAFVFSQTDGERHNTITPIARKKQDMFELDLVLRNNITTEEHPLGVFHPHAEYHNIKKENIGLIEVMGLAVLPARLKEETEVLAKAIVEHADIESNPLISKHANWAKGFINKYDNINSENVMSIIEKEIGYVFVEVLENAGVFKCNESGRAAFGRFIEYVNQK